MSIFVVFLLVIMLALLRLAVILFLLFAATTGSFLLNIELTSFLDYIVARALDVYSRVIWFCVLLDLVATL